MGSAWLQGWMFLSASREMTSHPSLLCGVCLQPSILQPGTAAPLAQFGSTLDEQREMKAKQGERREEQLFSISLCFPFAWLSLPLTSYHLFSLCFVRCGKGPECIFSRSVYSFPLIAERRKERYCKGIIQGPELSFFRLFCGSFQNKPAMVQLQQARRRNIVAFLHLAVFLSCSS